MHIVTWNCGGSFRTKYQMIKDLNPDICIIEECEDIELFKNQKKFSDFVSFHSNFIKTGERKHLAIFAKEGITLEKIKANYKMPKTNSYLECFLPVLVNQKYLFVGVWTKEVSKEKQGHKVFRYIGQFYFF